MQVRRSLTWIVAGRKIPNVDYHFLPGPGSSVGVDAGCQSRGCEFESQLAQHSFRHLTKFTLTSVIRLSPMGLQSMCKKQTVRWKVWCMEYWCEKDRKYMSRWTGRRDITYFFFKRCLNPDQSKTSGVNWLITIIVTGKYSSSSLSYVVCLIDFWL